MLEAVAKRLGIRAINEVAHLPGSGALREGANGLTILVKNTEDVRRQNFTVAHELGHAALRNYGSNCEEHPDVERLCNAFASELLLPAAAIRQEFRQLLGNGPASALSTIASRYEVSSEVVFYRIRELKLLHNTRSALIFVDGAAPGNEAVIFGDRLLATSRLHDAVLPVVRDLPAGASGHISLSITGSETLRLRVETIPQDGRFIGVHPARWVLPPREEARRHLPNTPPC